MSDLVAASDLSVTLWPDRNQGGQHVGVSTGVRVEHVPSGLVAIVDFGRSGHANRLVAIDMILGGLTSPHFR